MPSSKLFSLLCIIFISSTVFAQKGKTVSPIYKFGDVKVEDFAPSKYDIDPEASAVVLADIGSSKFEGNNHGDFSIVYKHFRRIRILNKNGFEHSKFEIVLHNNYAAEEKLENQEAVTYNINNGTVVSSKLDKSSIFKSQLVKGLSITRFSLPEIREGSIIEYSYSVKSPFYEYLRNWDFQSDVPKLWSQYDVAVPAIFNYVMEEQGGLNYTVDEGKLTKENYDIISSGGIEGLKIMSMNTDVVCHFWAIKDVPAFKTEAFTSSRENYLKRITFQMKFIKWPDGTIDDRMGNWQSFSNALMKNEYFGKDLSESNSFASDVDKVILNTSSQKQKAIKIFQYVRDNFICTSSYGTGLDNTLKKIYQIKKGNVAEINLLLTSLYRSRGFEADPVLLSTRENGRVNEIFPLRSKFNYLISRVKVDDDYYLVDASDNSLGFGIRGENLYNGSGRLIGETPILIPMLADSLKEKKFTSVFIYNDDDNKGMNGTYTSQLGTYATLALRKEVKKDGENEYYNKIKKGYLFDIKIKNQKIDSLNDLEKPVAINYDFTFDKSGGIIYFNPFLSGTLKENPFKSENRVYPVEMPYGINYTYMLNMEIPKGYVIDELPKPALVKLNDEEGYFEYILSKAEDIIQMRVKLVLNKATFLKEDYKTLRDFYAFVVKKESEMIVFKKIN